LPGGGGADTAQATGFSHFSDFVALQKKAEKWQIIG
jgi:hypothetical protein